MLLPLVKFSILRSLAFRKDVVYLREGEIVEVRRSGFKVLRHVPKRRSQLKRVKLVPCCQVHDINKVVSKLGKNTISPRPDDVEASF